MFDLHFLRPDYLWALVVVIPVVLGLCYASFVARRNSQANFGEAELLRRYTKPLTLRSELFVSAIWVLATTLVVIALAGPMSKSLPTTVKSGSLQVVAVVDVSKSMGAEDYRSNMPAKDNVPADLVPGRYGHRLGFVHVLLKEQVMPAIIGNQLGVVLYTGEAHEQVSLTDDWTATGWVLDNWMRIGNAPGGGSDYASGIDKALEMLKRDKIDGRTQVIVLFTDGGFSGEDEALSKTLEKLGNSNARLIVVGVGGKTPIPIKIYDQDGNVTGVEKKDGEVALTALDESAVVQLASSANSEYFILDPDSDGTLKVNWASKLGGSKTETKDNPVFQYPLGLAYLLLTGLFMRGLLRRKRVA